MQKALHRRATRRLFPVATTPAPIVLLILAAVLALTGGSSRTDVGLLLILRPVTVLCLTALLLTTPRFDWKPVRVPLILLGLFALTIVIQLIPLPPSVWHGLAGRDRYLDVLEAVDGARSWRPISIAPDMTWNSLVALIVPLTILVGYAALTENQRRQSLTVVILVILLSAIFGIVQMSGGPDSPLYYYEFMHRGVPDGFLANRNHQAALLAIALPLLRAWTLTPGHSEQEMRTRRAGVLAVSAMLVIVSLTTGSRAGLALMCVGILGAFVVHPKMPGAGLPPRTRWLVPAGLAAGFAALVLLVVEVNRAFAIDRLFGLDVLESEGRLINTPTSLEIIRDTMPLGTGFGSFAPVFKVYESDALLRPTYFNNAHNDLIELALTGGVPSLLVLGLFLIWWGWLTYRSFFRHHPSRYWRAVGRAASVAILMLLIASMTDYPLRTPLISAIFTMLCCWLSHAGGAPAVAAGRSDRDQR